MGRGSWIAIGVWSLSLVGCATYAQRAHSLRTSFLNGDLASAEKQLERNLRPWARSRELAMADRALVELVSGHPERAENLLREVRDGFDRLEGKRPGEFLASVVTDDRALAYEGEDYEKVLVRCLLAVSNLLHDGAEVIPYCLQATRKQRAIIQDGIGISDSPNPKGAYKQVALAPYLHGVIAEASHRNYDDAERAYATVAAWTPEFFGGRLDLERARGGVHSAPGDGVLYVIALVGPGPYKREATAPVTSDALALASILIRAAGDRNVPIASAPVKIPEIAIPPAIVHTVQVTVNGGARGVTETITDVSLLARQQYEASLPYIVARAAARRAVKKSAVYAAKSQLNVSPLAGVAFDAGSFVWEMAESADLRCWNLLPGQIQVLRVPLASGVHTLQLQPVLVSGAGPAVTCPVEIADGQNTYALVCYPGPHLAGRIVTSRSP